MNIYVDIDETIADYQPEDDRTNYNLATPIDINIDKINKLYNEGNWGCKYHKLITGHKPAYDLIICDKSMRIEEL